MSIFRINDRPSHPARAAGAFASLLALLLGLIASVPAAAVEQASDEFPTEPVLRLATPMHTAPIRRIDVDVQQRFLVSTSDDKTARVWDLETGRLIRILRVPIARGAVGQLYGVAISPDGGTVAVGGFTGLRGHSKFVYIFDRATGTVQDTITGLPNLINHLAFSKNGRYLAAVLSGLNGLRVYETKEYDLVAEDKEYAAGSYGVDFDAAGRLVTTSLDGHVRLYSPKFRLLRKEPAPGGGQPFSAVFSPDGRTIAVGYNDSTRVDVLRSDDLRLLYSADTETADNNDLTSVAWSDDGRYLYAGGQYAVGSEFPIRRWDDAGRGDWVEFKVATDTVMGLRPLRDGRLAVASQDPLVSVLDADGQVIWEQRSDIARFRASEIHLSKNGRTVQFSTEPIGKRPARFSQDQWQLDLDPPEPDDLLGPTTVAPGLEITDLYGESPKLNGEPLELHRGETSRSLAIAPDDQRFLLGSEWYVRLFDREGSELWKVDAPGIAWAVNVSADGQHAVAAYGDGTIRWYRMTDGQELLALFPHRDGQRWITWTPQGYYNASAGAEDLIGWHLNRGLDEAPQFFGASRFRDQFYRPDIMARVLDTLDVDEAVRLADKERKGRKTVAKNVRSILPPQITILAPASGTKTESNRLTLMYKAESPIGAIENIEARVNDRPAQVQSHYPNYSDESKQSMVGQITVEVPPHDATIFLIARNANGASEPATFFSNWSGESEWYKPDLYVLAVGVSVYREDRISLDYAAKDATDFVEAIQKQEGGLYKNVYPLLLPDDRATREEVLDGLEWLERQTTSRDVAMVFLSGHGINGERGKYQFLPHDFDSGRAARTSVHNYEIEDFLSRISGKVVLFFDTCHSGSVSPGRKADQQADVDKFANELADTDSGVIVFSSSTGKQFSVEKDKWENGAFTEALVEAIEGQGADYTEDWHVSIAELEVYLSKRVKELTGGEQRPVTAKPKAVEDFTVFRIDRS